ncbi:MAG: hypothetical protein RLZZ479_678 [Bacteroidota bacterium]|jgi:endonuclease YncB( thermonuclease family)
MKNLLKILLLSIFSTVTAYAQTDSIATDTTVYTQSDSIATNAKVFAVHDGDSYKIKFDTSTTNTFVWVRLYAADCPEVYSPYVRKTQIFGREAGDHVREKIKGECVYVVPMYADIYDRMVAKIYVNGKDLSEYLIENGYAWFYDPGKEMPKEEREKLKELQKNAKKQKLGLWGQKGIKVSPWTFRKRNV